MLETVRLCRDFMLYSCERCHVLFALANRHEADPIHPAEEMLLANPCPACKKGQIAPLCSVLGEINK
jgi:hypothetical protein